MNRLLQVVAIFAFLGLSVAQAPKTHPLVDKIAPDFVLPTADGKKFHLSDQRGKVVLLNFFSHW